MNEEDAIEGGGLLIRPKLICLKPFCIVYCSKDSFYSVLQSADSLVLYLSPEVSLIADFGKLSLGLQQVWNETIRYGIKFLSLSNEQLIDNRKIYRVIHEKSLEGGNSDKKVYHLI